MITPKIPENLILSNADCIALLEDIKKRTCFYDEQFAYMGKEYCEKLAGVESLAIDKAISILQNSEQHLSQEQPRSPVET